LRRAESPAAPVGVPQLDGPSRLRGRDDACMMRASFAEGAYDSARMTEIPPMSSLFISTID
jgi:hypothetical protein